MAIAVVGLGWTLIILTVLFSVILVLSIKGCIELFKFIKKRETNIQRVELTLVVVLPLLCCLQLGYYHIYIPADCRSNPIQERCIGRVELCDMNTYCHNQCCIPMGEKTIFGEEWCSRTPFPAYQKYYDECWGKCMGEVATLHYGL